jgi:hypothetical protein
VRLLYLQLPVIEDIKIEDINLNLVTNSLGFRVLGFYPTIVFESKT